MKRLVFAVIAALWAIPVAAQPSLPPGSLYPPVIVFPASAVNGAGVFNGALTGPLGACSSGNVTYGFSAGSPTGMYSRSGGFSSFCSGGTASAEIEASQFGMRSSLVVGWHSAALGAGLDTGFSRAGPNAIVAGNGTQGDFSATFKAADIVGSTDVQAPLFRTTAGTKILLQGASTNATQLSTTQTTVPTCSNNCGTSPAVAGTDTFMKVTMGSSGVPASPFTVTFNGTWTAAPVCVVTSGLATMVVGKMGIAAPTTTTTVIVTTNGTAPGTGDVYFIHCGGVQ